MSARTSCQTRRFPVANLFEAHAEEEILNVCKQITNYSHEEGTSL
jgi:hypothetical protein